MANTIASKVYRDKYRTKKIASALRNMCVCEKICEVDRTAVKTIQNPYGSAPSVTVQALAGTYSTADFTTTDDTLTVNNEFIVAEHIKDFENFLANYDLFKSRVAEQMAAVAIAMDRFVLNNLCEDGTGTYTTPTGGFTTAANVNEILANLVSKVAGYSETFNGLFLVLENTDLTGFIQAQLTSGFSFADAALNNGFLTSQMGIDIYVVRSGTYADETLGTTTYTNAGHRVFGVKNMATYAAPRDITYEEKSVSGKTGKEVVTYGYIGFKLWATKVTLIIDITLA